MSLILWYLDLAHSDDILPAPSYEAAAAVCGPDDRVKPWRYGKFWHREKAAKFLELIEPVGELQ